MRAQRALTCSSSGRLHLPAPIRNPLCYKPQASAFMGFARSLPGLLLNSAAEPLLGPSLAHTGAETMNDS
jgi:hypothetical protein